MKDGEPVTLNNFAKVNDLCRHITTTVKDNPGKVYEVIFRRSKERNYQFHKKIFSLLKFAYDNTEKTQVEYKGELITKSPEQFRKEAIILSGYYSIDVVGDGKIRFVADSISYDKCSQKKAEAIYSALLDVVAKKIFESQYSHDELERLSAEWMSYT